MEFIGLDQLLSWLDFIEARLKREGYEEAAFLIGMAKFAANDRKSDGDDPVKGGKRAA